MGRAAVRSDQQVAGLDGGVDSRGVTQKAVGKDYSTQNKNPSSIPEEGLIYLPCDPSAGIIRIRFAGRGLAALLSAWMYRLPVHNSKNCLEYKMIW
jgi:hypothetical protein